MADIQAGQIIYGPFSTDKVLQRALMGRRGFKIPTYVATNPADAFSKRRILVPTGKAREIKKTPYDVYVFFFFLEAGFHHLLLHRIGLSLRPAEVFHIPNKLDLEAKHRVIQSADATYIPDSSFKHFFVVC